MTHIEDITEQVVAKMNAYNLAFSPPRLEFLFGSGTKDYQNLSGLQDNEKIRVWCFPPVITPIITEGVAPKRTVECVFNIGKYCPLDSEAITITEKINEIYPETEWFLRNLLAHPAIKKAGPARIESERHYLDDNLVGWNIQVNFEMIQESESICKTVSF